MNTNYKMIAKELGHHSQVILAERAINDYMPKYVALLAIKGLNDAGKVIKGSKVLIMGLTYKENISDAGESPVKEMIKELKDFSTKIYGYDPLLSRQEIKDFGIEPIENLEGKFDCIIVTVAHDKFKRFTLRDIKNIMNDRPVLIDARGIFNEKMAKKLEIYYKSL